MKTDSLVDLTSLIEKGSYYNEYQPLWSSSTDSIFAYEALIRTTPRVNPLQIFEYGREKGHLYKFDTTFILNAIKEFPKTYFKSYFLFINIFPSTIIHSSFSNFILEILSKYPEIKGRIVFEINEDPHEEIHWIDNKFIEGLAYLKQSGFLIALDDLVINSITFEKIYKLKPHFAKLDRAFSVELANSHVKQEDIRFLLAFSKDKTIVVLEGIEKHNDLEKAKQLGVPLLQGYYIQKPRRLDKNFVSI